MKLPLQVVFLGMEPSAAVDAAAREKAARLDHFSPDIMSCRVEIDLSHKHKHQGRPYAVRIHLTLPRHELTVDRVENEDVYVALRDAFETMGRTVFAHGVMNWTKDDHWGYTNETGVIVKVVNGDWKME